MSPFTERDACQAELSGCCAGWRLASHRADRGMGLHTAAGQLDTA